MVQMTAVGEVFAIVRLPPRGGRSSTAFRRAWSRTASPGKLAGQVVLGDDGTQVDVLLAGLAEDFGDDAQRALLDEDGAFNAGAGHSARAFGETGEFDDDLGADFDVAGGGIGHSDGFGEGVAVGENEPFRCPAWRECRRETRFLGAAGRCRLMRPAVDRSCRRGGGGW